jgi:hypothetical protein
MAPTGAEVTLDRCGRLWWRRGRGCGARCYCRGSSRWCGRRRLGGTTRRCQGRGVECLLTQELATRQPDQEHQGPDGRRLADWYPTGGSRDPHGSNFPVVRFPNPNDARETARRRGETTTRRTVESVAYPNSFRARHSVTKPSFTGPLVERSGVGPQPELVDHHRRHRDGVPGTTGPAPGASWSVPAHPVAVARTVHVWLEACLSGA